MANPSADYPGVVNSGYLTAKMPSWAGVPQNLTGTDLEGKRVPETNDPSFPRRLATPTSVSLAVAQLRIDLESLETRLRNLEQAANNPAAAV